MYSKNDYRYYLEHRLAQSDDFLAHYGVEGMKWKNRKRKPDLYGNSLFDTYYGDVRRPGQVEKALDKYKAKKTARELVNKTHKYRWNENKSVGKNIERNIKTAKRRSKLKKAANKAIDAAYGPVQLKEAYKADRARSNGTYGKKQVTVTKKEKKPKREQTFGKMSKRDKELTKIGREVAREMNAKKPKKTYHEAVYDKKTKSYKLVKRNG